MADKGADEISAYTTSKIGINNFGECPGMRLNINNGIDDSGTESGEEVRVLKPEVIQEVQTALSRLEDVIPGLDPTKRDAVSQLVNSLQTCLKIPPPNPPPPIPPPRRFGSKKSLKNRHTVGVTREELADARKWIDDHNLNKRHSPQNVYGSSDSIAIKVFRPVKFIPPIPVIEEKVVIPPYLTRMAINRKQYHRPSLHRAGYFMEPGPQNGILSYIEPEPCLSTDRSTSDTGSLYDYDPSLTLFTPEQSVQIAVHKAAINKQISREEMRRRGSSEDGDVSSGDEENNNLNCHKELSSAQRLLQLATDDKPIETNKQNGRSGKKMKMKRSNTIDIPKPSNFYDYSSDEYGISADEGRLFKAYDDLPRHFGREKKIIPPTFEPKTENDLKFLAFLNQVNGNNNPSKVQSYNPCARGGKHWQNRFSSIKTAFEGPGNVKPPPQPSAAKLFWENAQNDQFSVKQNKTQQPTQSKLPWTVKTEENGVVVGSLTVSKPGHVNHFKHAALSAFKPIEKKQAVVSPVSGSVKQIAAQKFSITPTQEVLTKPEKNVKSPLIKNSNLNYIKSDYNKNEVKNFPLNSNLTQKTYSSAYFAPKQETPRGVITSKFLNEQIASQKKDPQVFSKDNQPTKMWSYAKLENKEPIIRAHAQFKTVESQPKKEPAKPIPSYARNTGRLFETSSPIINKKPLLEPLTSENWPNNNNSVHYNNVIRNRVEEDNREKNGYGTSSLHSYQYNTGSVYSKLPFANDHIPTVHNRNKVEMNGHDVQHRQQNSNSLIKPSASKNYFNDLNSRNASLIPFSTPSLISKEKQRFSLPENKLIDQYQQNTSSSKSSDTVDKIRSLELRIPEIPDCSGKLPSPQSSNYHLYNHEKFDDRETKPLAVPRGMAPDGTGDLKMPGNIEYYSESPINSILLSPEDNISTSTPHNILNSPQLSTFTYSSEERMTPSELQKPSLSPHLSNYSQSPQNMMNTFERISPAKLSPGYKIPEDRFISISSYESQHSKSPIKLEDSNVIGSSPYYWTKDALDFSRGRMETEECTEGKAVTRVMGQAQCQQAVTINNRTKTRFDSPKNIESELKLLVHQSAKQKALSPSFPNVLQKSESWHQMVKEQMQQAKQAPPLPKLSKAKSSHSLALPKQFEAALTPESLPHKKITVSQYLSKQTAHSHKKSRQSSLSKVKTNSSTIINKNNNSLDDDLENVDEVFESIFQESSKKRCSK